MSDASDLDGFVRKLKAAQKSLQKTKREQFDRRVSFGDLITERHEIAAAYGFGDGTTCYDNVLVIGHVTVGKNTWIGPGCILDGSGGLTIGDHCTLSAGVQIYSHDTVQRTISMGEAAIETAETVIGNGVYFGPNAVVQKGVVIGDHTVIGALSLVNTPIPSHARAWGTPARVIE
jgi:acetyltransferase-like isoleucine patch superfamily enzyme